MADPRVLIIGGGFGGLEAAKALRGAPVEVTLVDRANHHLFQPLLYQVAMAGLSPAEIAIPIRSVLCGQANARVLLGEVESFDLSKKEVKLVDGAVLGYEFLIVAARTAYFGHNDWAKFAPGLKTVDDALEIRRRVLLAFENAERCEDPAIKRRLLTFVVIGAGPTGVELAGALSELARRVLAKDFRSVRTDETKVILVEGGPRVLASFDPSLSTRAEEVLKRLYVDVRTNAKVAGISEKGVELVGGEVIAADTVIWAAGVGASPLGQALGVPIDKCGRVVVGSDCTVPDHPEVFVVGDLAHFKAGEGTLPSVSPVAMQQGRYVARLIRESPKNKARPPFVYFDKGSMATIGRSQAVAQMGKIRFGGFLAWVAWLVIHIWYLVGFKNRMFVFLTWIFAYVVYRRGARLITRGHVE